MKNTDKAGSKIFRFIHFRKHAENNIPDSRKKKVEKRTILQEINAQLFWDGKYTMPVNTGNEFTGHMKRAEQVVFVAAGRAETALATEGNKFKITTVSAGIHGTAVRRVTTMNHLVDIFNDGRTGM